MTYAQIKNGLIKNTIVLDDVTLEEKFLEGFDYLLRIDNLDTIPGIGWTYNSETDSYTAPVYDNSDEN